MQSNSLTNRRLLSPRRLARRPLLRHPRMTLSLSPQRHLQPHQHLPRHHPQPLQHRPRRHLRPLQRLPRHHLRPHRRLPRRHPQPLRRLPRSHNHHHQALHRLTLLLIKRRKRSQKRSQLTHLQLTPLLTLAKRILLPTPLLTHSLRKRPRRSPRKWTISSKLSSLMVTSRSLLSTVPNLERATSTRLNSRLASGSGSKQINSSRSSGMRACTTRLPTTSSVTGASTSTRTCLAMLHPLRSRPRISYKCLKTTLSTLQSPWTGGSMASFQMLSIRACAAPTGLSQLLEPLRVPTPFSKAKAI